MRQLSFAVHTSAIMEMSSGSVELHLPGVDEDISVSAFLARESIVTFPPGSLSLPTTGSSPEARAVRNCAPKGDRLPSGDKPARGAVCLVCSVCG